MVQTLLIDADIIAYRACSATERETEWEEDEWTITSDLKEARASFDMAVDHLRQQANVRTHVLCFSDTSNYRKRIDPSYKGNRASRKPVGYKAFRNSLLEDYKELCVCKPNIEADDCIGILATIPKQAAQMIIWSADKDLKQIPGVHLIDDELVTITEEEGDRYFLTQVLTGDQADNYSGCPGIGPKKAEAILDSADLNWWPAVVAAYEKVGLTVDDAIHQARLARILRRSDWNHDKQEPILWTPPAIV